MVVSVLVAFVVSVVVLVLVCWWCRCRWFWWVVVLVVVVLVVVVLVGLVVVVLVGSGGVGGGGGGGTVLVGGGIGGGGIGGIAYLYHVAVDKDLGARAGGDGHLNLLHHELLAVHGLVLGPAVRVADALPVRPVKVDVGPPLELVGWLVGWLVNQLVGPWGQDGEGHGCW